MKIKEGDKLPEAKVFVIDMDKAMHELRASGGLRVKR